MRLVDQKIDRVNSCFLKKIEKIVFASSKVLEVKFEKTSMFSLNWLLEI